MADEDQVVETEVAAEGYCGGSESCEEGACCGVRRRWLAWVWRGGTRRRGELSSGVKGRVVVVGETRGNERGRGDEYGPERFSMSPASQMKRNFIDKASALLAL